jgi:hypothetical protein
MFIGFIFPLGSLEILLLIAFARLLISAMATSVASEVELGILVGVPETMKLSQSASTFGKGRFLAAQASFTFLFM